MEDFIEEQESALLQGLPSKRGYRTRNTRASVFPSDEACCIALDLLYAAEAQIGVRIRRCRIVLKFWSNEGFVEYFLYAGRKWMECTSHCVKDTSCTARDDFTVFTASHVASKGDA